MNSVIASIFRNGAFALVSIATLHSRSAAQNQCTLLSDIPYYPAGTCATIPPFVPPACGALVSSTQCLDLRLPADRLPGGPTILFVHGGGWGGGSKSADAAFLNRLCDLGYAVASCNYTLACDDAATPGIYDLPSYPNAIVDVRAAIGWIRTTGVQPPYELSSCVVIVGASAGGHLASMAAALNDDNIHHVPFAYGAVDLRVQVAIVFSGDYDMFRRGCDGGACIGCPTDLPAHSHLPGFGTTTMSEVFIGHTWQTSSYAFLHCPASWSYTGPLQATMTSDHFLNASPTHWVHPTSAPFYMFHSDSDRHFPTDDMSWMAKALNAHGVGNTTVIEPCFHGLDIYGQVGSADVVHDVIQNGDGYPHCE